MNNLQLTRLMKTDTCLRNNTLGVFPSDKLPEKIYKLPVCLIANTDPSNEPGKHWVAFYIDSEGRGEFFDSYGREPENPNFRNFLETNCETYGWNDRRLQGYISSVCGQYCLYYLYRRCRGTSLREFLSEFD